MKTETGLAIRKTLFVYLSLAIITAFSFYFYAPCFNPYFNSDHAIQVLMSQTFSWPRDVYYWGQNRVGSLLPLLSHGLLKIIPIHPLYACSIVQYVLLLVPAIIISTLFQNPWLKLAFFTIVLIPVSDYVSLLYLTHPYAPQLFCGTLFVYFSYLFLKKVNASGQTGIIHSFTVWGTLLLAEIFYFLGIWVSEFNAILCVIPLSWWYLNYFRNREKSVWKKHLLYTVEIIVYAISAGLLYQLFKSYGVADNEYDNSFFFSKAEIGKQFSFMCRKIADTWTFADHRIIENAYYYFALIFIVIAWLLKRKIEKTEHSKWFWPLMLTASISFIVLFFSTWNLRSEYCPRYYTPVYCMVWTAILLVFDRRLNKYLSSLFTLLLIGISVTYLYMSLIRHDRATPFEKYGMFRDLPRGTLIAGYWESYVINSVACYNLQSIPFEKDLVRNWKWREVVLAEDNIYFLNNKELQTLGLKDTITQFERNFIFTGKKYNCNGIEVLLYRKQER